MTQSSSNDDANTVVCTDRDALRSRTAPGTKSRTVVAPGATIGRYLVIGELGRGAMGAVLRAYDPKLQREVALKVLATDALGEEARARMVREARAMAQLSHPHVVGVYDVELESDEGVVLVMEYVAGMTLRAWLTAEPRSWREILGVLVASGRGLAAAHAEGLLHRDFKPDNVLVGDDGRVRVTDFGLARATHAGSLGDSGSESLDMVQAFEAASELTVAGVVMGTPAFMAPEQHRGGALDARTDQYALCVTAWRALTGQRPFEGRGQALLEAKLAGPPPWPSKSPGPRHVVEAIRRGLAPDPAERWPTVEALLLELERDPSRRRRAYLFVATCGGVAAGVLGWQSLERARALGACVERGESIAEVWNEDRAHEIGVAFESTGIAYAEDTWSRARARLDAWVEDWQTMATDVCEQAIGQSPDADGPTLSCLDELRGDLEALLELLATPDAAIVHKAATAAASLPLLARCRDDSRLRGEELPDALSSEVRSLRRGLAESSAARSMGRHEDARARAQEVLEAAIVLEWDPLVAEAKLELGRALESLGDYEGALVQQSEAFFLAGSVGRDELALEAATSLVRLTGYSLARYDDATRWDRVAQMLMARLGLGEDLALASRLGTLGNLQRSRGAHAEALAAHRRRLEIVEDLLGNDHPHAAAAHNGIGLALWAQGEYDEALASFERARDVWQIALGPEHPDVAAAINNMGLVHAMRGNEAEALHRYEEALVLMERALGSEHPDVAGSLANVGGMLALTGRIEEALVKYERSLAIREKSLGPDHPLVAASLNNIGDALLSAEETERARPYLERALGIWEQVHGNDHPYVAMVCHNLGAAHEQRGRHGEAVAMYERALRIREGGDVPPAATASTRFALARALWSAGEDRSRARDLAVAAREALDQPEDEGQRDAIDAWLAAH
jgi:eukaryotic-like serine/threonine-protein kinase